MIDIFPLIKQSNKINISKKKKKREIERKILLMHIFFCLFSKIKYFIVVVEKEKK